jgi:hypothetical protein
MLQMDSNTCIQVDPYYRSKLQKFKLNLSRKSPNEMESYYTWVKNLQEYLENVSETLNWL